MPTIPSLPPFPTISDVEEYFFDATAYIPHIPQDVAIAVRSIYEDLMRFGPPEFPELPELSDVGKLFVVQVPAAAPAPPPVPKSATERAIEWMKDHKLACSVAGIATLGVIGYSAYNYKAAHDRLVTLRKRVASKRKTATPPTEPEREIVIILGADSVSYGPSVVRDFQKNGYIVLASVFSGEAADDLERDTEGYVRALVLDAEEPGSIPHFLRSLSSTLSLRFPTNVHGDPYQSMTTSQSISLARVASVISFLSLGPTDLLPFNSFSSPITFSESYTHEFMTRALSPLSILHATLPLFRNRKAIGSPKESNYNTLQGASVILCVPAAARVGVLGSSSNSMANAAVVQGFKVLKREAALDPSLEDTNLRFITLDVGEFRLQKESKKKLGTARTPTDIRVLTNTLLGIVNSSRRPWSLQWLWTVWLGSRRSVGAGATTYAVASQLPTVVLDFLLLLPHRLTLLRESLQATRETPPPTPAPAPKSPVTAPSNSTSKTPLSESQRTDVGAPTPSESEAESSAYTSSEADGEASTSPSQVPTRANTIADSWVSVKDDE